MDPTDPNWTLEGTGIDVRAFTRTWNFTEANVNSTVKFSPLDVLTKVCGAERLNLVDPEAAKKKEEEKAESAP